jgi:hypothetical protein
MVIGQTIPSAGFVGTILQYEDDMHVVLQAFPAKFPEEKWLYARRPWYRGITYLINFVF